MSTRHRKTTDERLYAVAEEPFTSMGSRSAYALPGRNLMTSLGIDFEDGFYRFEGFRYDNLVDAANYARLMLQRRNERDA
jgi:hypothetical protein